MNQIRIFMNALKKIIFVYLWKACNVNYPCFPMVWIHLQMNAAKTAAPGATSYELRYLPGPSRADHIFTLWQTFSFVFSSIYSKSGILIFDQSDHYKISQNLIHTNWSTYLAEVFSYKTLVYGSISKCYFNLLFYGSFRV